MIKRDFDAWDSIDAKLFIARFEGCKLKAYKCSAGVWTIGYGHTDAVYEGMEIPKEEAEYMFEFDLKEFKKRLVPFVKVQVTKGQFIAIMSLAFNIGINAFKNSTLLRKLNAGLDVSASDEFLRWNKAGGKVIAGLTRRRTEECRMFLDEF